MASDINSAELCLKAVRVLQDELRKAKKTLINSENCVVNRGVMTVQLEYLQDNLPDTVEKAAEIVAQEETIRTETEQKRTEILENASAQAQNMVNDATRKAQQIRRIVEDAEKKAQELVEEENIVRRARVESDELRENARQEAANLHKNTLDYIDSLLAETDRKMSELLNNIRLERNEIRNHR